MSACINANEDKLVTGHTDGIIKIWDINDNFSGKAKLSTFDKNKEKLKQILLTPSNTLYAYGGNGTIIALFFRNC